MCNQILFIQFLKQSKIITDQPKDFENPKIVDIKSIKSIITEQPKASHKLSKTVRQPEKVDSSNSLYIDTKKVKICKRKNVNLTNDTMPVKVLQILRLLKFEILLTLYYRILNLQFKVIW